MSDDVSRARDITGSPMTAGELASLEEDFRGVPIVDRLIGEVRRLQESEDEYVVLCDRLSELLTQTAAALKGPPEPLTMHDWSDLPAVAAKLVEHHNRRHHAGML